MEVLEEVGERRLKFNLSGFASVCDANGSCGVEVGKFG